MIPARGGVRAVAGREDCLRQRRIKKK
jgi:hypothetical protein